MSALSELIALVEDRVQDLLPAYSPAPFVYDLAANNRKNDKIFGVRLGSSTSSAGLNSWITIDTSIGVDLSQKFLPKKAEGDESLRDKIAELTGDIETIYKTLYRRAGALDSASLILIAPVDVSEPNIDNDNNLVTLTLTLSVKYRVAS
jgi:hypothetical protein